MGTIAILLRYFLSVIPTDRGERRHVHVYGTTRCRTRQTCLAKIWIEKEGRMCVEVAYNNGLPPKDLRRIIAFIEKNYSKIDDSISRSFNGEKTQIIK